MGLDCDISVHSLSELLCVLSPSHMDIKELVQTETWGLWKPGGHGQWNMLSFSSVGEEIRKSKLDETGSQWAKYKTLPN